MWGINAKYNSVCNLDATKPQWDPETCRCYCPFGSIANENTAIGDTTKASGCPNDWYHVNEANCSCECNKTHPNTLCQDAAHAATPVFDKDTCSCTCPAEIAEHCNSDATGCPVEYDAATCTCKHTHGLTAGPVFKKDQNENTEAFSFAQWCSGTHSEDQCDATHPSFDPSTCSCYCKFTTSDARLSKAAPEGGFTWNEDSCSYTCEEECSGSTPFLDVDTCTCGCPTDGADHCSDDAEWDPDTCKCIDKDLTWGSATYKDDWHFTSTDYNQCTPNTVTPCDKTQTTCTDGLVGAIHPKPAFDPVDCSCYCPSSQDECSLHQDIPFFDDHQCGCTCPQEWQDACLTSNADGCAVASFDTDTCSCVGNNPTKGEAVFGAINNFDFDAWCPADSKHSEAECDADHPSFDPVTCSCYCKFDTNIPERLQASQQHKDLVANFENFSNCAYTCTKSAESCAANPATPYFNPETCTCFCAVVDQCSDNGVFNAATCECDPKPPVLATDPVNLAVYKDGFQPGYFALDCDGNVSSTFVNIYPAGHVEGDDHSQGSCTSDAATTAAGSDCFQLVPAFNPFTYSCECPIDQNFCNSFGRDFDVHNCNCKCREPDGGCAAGTFWDRTDCACQTCGEIAFCAPGDSACNVFCSAPDCAVCNPAAAEFDMTTCQCEWKTNFSQTDPTNPQARYNAGWTTEMCMDSCIKGQDDCNAQDTTNLLAG